MLHFQQGTPFIYQGEELGMTNAKFTSIDDYQDIETHNIYQDFINHKHLSKEYTMKAIYLKSRDNARTPMQWTSKHNAGFTTGTPWLSVNPNYTRINVEQALKDKDSIFYYYQQLIKLRHSLSIVTTGDFELLDPDNEQVFSYLRRDQKQILLVAGNFTEKPKKLFCQQNCRIDHVRRSLVMIKTLQKRLTVLFYQHMVLLLICSVLIKFNRG